MLYENEEKELEVVSGTGKELDISPVYDHIKLDKPSNVDTKQEIIVPKAIKKDNKGNNKKEDKNKEGEKQQENSNTAKENNISNKN